MNKYFELLKNWCDEIIRCQITEMKKKEFYGGILCPSCAVVHGRIADTVYPLTLVYEKTNDEKYLNAARLAVMWAKNNVLRKNKGFFNDKINNWMGISVFTAISFGETLYYHSECLDLETKREWTKIFIDLTEFIYDYFDSDEFCPNINYPVSECAQMAIAYSVTKNEKYKNKAYEKFNMIKEMFTEDGLLFGESNPNDYLSPKGCRGVDIGYNAEESMPALVMFAHYLNDESAMKFCIEKFKSHLEFMIPDGGWDNSWGTRANKWTYWGSRTSDGCQTGLCILAKYDSVFAEAAQRNFNMYKRCTKTGLLYGGLMYADAGEEPCIHHSFCHAKALASMIDCGFCYEEKVKLPRDCEYGVKYFSSVHINLISKGDWRATVSDCDSVMYRGSATTGGTMTLLWNKIVGPVFSASMASYDRTEPLNMQYSKNDDVVTNCALRIANGSFESVNDKEAIVKTKVTDDEITIDVCGNLCDLEYNKNGSYTLKYIFQNNKIFVKALSELGGDILIPLICSKSDIVESLDNNIKVKSKSGIITVESESAIEIPNDTSVRNFSLIGGFETLPLKIRLTEKKECSFSVFVI